MYIYFFVCSELIKETGSFPNLIFDIYVVVTLGLQQQVEVSTRNLPLLAKLWLNVWQYILLRTDIFKNERS